MAKKIPVFSAIVENNRLNLIRQDLFRIYMKIFKEKEVVELTIKKKTDLKTNPQLKYYMGVLVPQAHTAFLENGETVVKDEGEVPISSYDADRKLKKLFLTRNKGTDFEYVPSKADITIEMMSYLIEQSLHYLAINYEVYIETAEEWKDSYRIMNEGDK